MAGNLTVLPIVKIEPGLSELASNKGREDVVSLHLGLPCINCLLLES